MSDLAAGAAANAVIVDVGHGIEAQRVRVGLEGQGGQPDSRMQEWSPVQASSSTPKRLRTTRLPDFSRFWFPARRRRCRAS